MTSDCLFCRVIAKQVPAAIVAEDAQTLAFEDIRPQAPTHVLIVPKHHIASLAELTEQTVGVMATLTGAATRLAKRLGLEHGYRLVVNCGPHGGQSVAHLHVHLLGGREMRWPPG